MPALALALVRLGGVLAVAVAGAFAVDRVSDAVEAPAGPVASGVGAALPMLGLAALGLVGWKLARELR
jgi:hypothetical protein